MEKARGRTCRNAASMGDSGMARPYGKFKRTFRKGPQAPEAPAIVRADLFGPYDMEQASYIFQTLLARLQEQGINGISKVSVTFEPLQGGELAAVRDETGKPVDAMKIRLPAALRFAKAIGM